MAFSVKGETLLSSGNLLPHPVTLEHFPELPNAQNHFVEKNRERRCCAA